MIYQLIIYTRTDTGLTDEQDIIVCATKDGAYV